jgi:hypothetical protein
MALENSIGACLTGCGSVPIKDVTGLYNPVNNLVGWGFPNLEREDVVSATLTLTFTNSKGTVTTETIDVTTEVQDSLLADIELTTYEVSQDGILDIRYVIEGPEDAEYETETSIGIFCNVECCVDKLALKAAKTACNPCEKGRYPTTFDVATTLLSALPKISVCLNRTDYFSVLKQLERICGSDCGCGCS